MVTTQPRRGETRQRRESRDSHITQAQLGGRGTRRLKAAGPAGWTRRTARPPQRCSARGGQPRQARAKRDHRLSRGAAAAPGAEPARGRAGQGGSGRAGARGRAPGRVLPALRRCPVITASPVSGCSQVVLFASSLRGRTHGPSQAGAAPPPSAPPPPLPFLPFPARPSRPGPAPLLAGPALT